MAHQPQIRIPATYMRGGTSKGVFFRLQDLPAAAQVPGAARDALLMRVIGSPDPYGKQIDGMGGATSSTSKTVIIAKSERPGHDVDYLFGQVSIDQKFVDWSGNCGNLSAAVGPFAISGGLVDPARVPRDGVAVVRIWQANIGKTIIAHVPMTDGAVQETGDFELDGVTFPAAEIQLEFLDPAAEEDGEGGAMFPTGHLIDDLEVPGVGTFKATMINAGIPTIFLNAEDIGYRGTELQDAINSDPKALAMFETIRAHGALRMGLIKDLSEAATRQHTPKVAFVAKPAGYTASSGKVVNPGDIDLLVRALSMGKLHHAMMGTAAVCIGAAASIPGTLVNLAAGGGARNAVRFGHPSGTLRVGAEAKQEGGEWTVTKAIMSRSARVLMEGWVRIPGNAPGDSPADAF
jgi:probable AcnD-accessory protein PrpF